MRRPLLEGITFSAILWPVKPRRPDPVSSFSASRHAYRAETAQAAHNGEVKYGRCHELVTRWKHGRRK
jgi:hypothetical protein